MINMIKEVFSLKYRKNTEYLQQNREKRPYIKLKCSSESIDTKMNRLIQINYESECSVYIGDF